MPVGTYGFAAWRVGTLYEGAAATPPVHLVGISDTTPAVRNFDLPAAGHVQRRGRRREQRGGPRASDRRRLRPVGRSGLQQRRHRALPRPDRQVPVRLRARRLHRCRRYGRLRHRARQLPRLRVAWRGVLALRSAGHGDRRRRRSTSRRRSRTCSTRPASSPPTHHVHGIAERRLARRTARTACASSPARASTTSS